MFTTAKVWHGAAVLLTVLSGCPSVASAESLADAIALAYQSNPTLQQQRAQLRALDETYVQAQAGWRPTATAQTIGSYSKTPQAGLFGGTNQVETNAGQVSIEVTQPIYTGGRTAAEVRATEADVLAGRQQLRAVEATLLQNVVTVYSDVLRDQQLRRIHEDDVATLQGEVEDSLARLKAGEVTATDVAQTRTQLAQSRSAMIAAQGQLQVSRANYAAVVGQNPGTLTVPDEMPGVPSDVDKAFDIAEQENASLLQAEQTEEASRARVAEARAAERPTLSVRADIGIQGGLTPLYGRDYDRALSATVALTQPIFTGGVNQSNIRRALELNTSDRVGIELARRAAVQAVSQGWNGIITARTEVKSEENHVETAREYFSDERAEYTVGQRSTLDIIIAEQSLVEAKITLTEVQHDAVVAEASLLAAMGRLETRYVTPGTPLYEPAASFRRVAHAGALPWDHVVAAIDNLGAPSPGAYRSIPAPNAAVAPVIGRADDHAEDASVLAMAVPTAPLPNTTSARTPETLGTAVGSPEDESSRGSATTAGTNDRTPS